MSDTHNAVVEHEVARLRALAPFDCVDAEILDAVLSASRLAFFPVGSRILHPALGGSNRELHIVREGSVMPVPVDASAAGAAEAGPIGAGGMFPAEAIDGEPAMLAYTAHADSFCWIVGAPVLARLLEQPAVLAWLLGRRGAEARALRRRYAADSEAGHIAAEVLHLPLSAVARRSPVSVPPETTIAQTTAIMARERVGSVLVADRTRPAGIVTESDLLRRVFALAGDAEAPVSSAMTARPFVLPGSATVAEAALEMTSRGIRHIPVVDDSGELAGIVSERDLFRLQRHGIGHFAAPIERAETMQELAAAVAGIREAGRAIFSQGMSAEALTHLISSLNDRVTHRVLELARRPSDPADGFCWLAFGSEGRHEQTFSTDQDNGIIFTGVLSQRKRFLDYAERVNAALDECGFPLCKGGVMARNPDWCLTLDEWKEKFASWIRTPTPEALLFANIFFDFRPLHGDEALAESLRDHLFSLSRENTIFLQMMARNALDTTAPLGTFTRFTTDAAQGGTIDLKRRGAVIFVDSARIFALARGVRATNTAERLRLGGERIKRAPTVIDADVSAFHFIQGLRLKAQLGLAGGGRSDDPNRIDPYALNELDQRMLRETLRQGQHLHERLKLDYRL